MTTPRAYKIDLESTPYYHCIARCVRRSYLCGEDAVTGKNFNHRKNWLVTRFKTLSEVSNIENGFAHAVGHAPLLLKFGLNTRDRALRGTALSNRCYVSTAAYS